MAIRLYHLMRTLFDLVALAIIFQGLVFGQAPFVEDAADDIGQRAAVAISSLPVSSLLVLPFAYADGVPCAEGALLAERVSTSLSALEGVSLVDRTQLERILEEQRLSASGLVNPASAIHVGKLMGAAAILSGSVTDLGENLEVHARITATESGEVLLQHALATRKTLKTFISPLWSRIEEIREEGESFKVELWADAATGVTGVPSRRIGEHVTLYFRADRDCYVTLFDFTTSGSIHVLFPNAFMKDNYIKAGRTYALPSEEAGFKIRVKGPPGVEKLKLFATTTNAPLFEHDFATESFRSVDETSYSTTRDLEVVLDSLDAGGWAEAHMELLIEQVLR